MAVTIHTSPDAYTPSGNPLTFVFSSDQTAQANFSYLVKIYVDAVLIETNEVFPESGIRAHFDCSDVAERYCNAINPQGLILQDSANYIVLQCTVQESYGTPPTPQLSASSSVFTYKGKLSKSNYQSITMGDYVFNRDKLWLTLFPRTEKRYIDLAYPNYFTFITNENTLQLRIELYLDESTVIQVSSAAVAATTKLTTYLLDNAQLLANGLLQANIDNALFMKVWVQTSLAAKESEMMTLWIDSRDKSTSEKHILFMSSLGGLEPYTFVKRTRVANRVKGHGFEQSYGNFDDAGDYVYTLGGSTDFVKEITEGIEVQSDWLSESEQNWLVRELTASPLVFLYEGTDLIRVKVTRTGYKYKTSENDMVFNEKFKIQLYKDTSSVL